ncbi:MAG: type I restriction-modification enzyme R subunit C-terminal domain-containing protein, partial [Bradymonadaceae bacterium]
EPLVPYAERVQFAVDRIEGRGDWSPEQRKWLDRIRKTLINDELVPDPDNLDEAPAFESRGGFDRIDDRHFDGELREVLDDMNDALWEYDAGA